MTNAELWSLIVGFISPMLIAVVDQPGWTRAARTAVQVAVSVVIGLATAYFAGDFTGKDVVSNILIASVAAISAYKGIFQPTGMAPRVARATSPSTVPRA